MSGSFQDRDGRYIVGHGWLHRAVAGRAFCLKAARAGGRNATAGQYTDSIPPLAAHCRASRLVKLPPVQRSALAERAARCALEAMPRSRKRSTRWLPERLASLWQVLT